MEIYTVEQVAKKLTVKPTTIQEWLRTGRLRGSKIGTSKIWRIQEDSIQEFLTSTENTPLKIS